MLGIVSLRFTLRYVVYFFKKYAVLLTFQLLLSYNSYLSTLIIHLYILYLYADFPIDIHIIVQWTLINSTVLFVSISL